MPDIRFITKITDSTLLDTFEKEHPEPLRWDPAYKQLILDSPNSQFIWVKEGRKVVGEAILTWGSSNVVRIESFTILAPYRGKGYGKDLIAEVMRWSQHKGFQFLIGEARKGTSWNIFKSLGAKKILEYYDWGGTGETYILFKTKL